MKRDKKEIMTLRRDNQRLRKMLERAEAERYGKKEEDEPAESVEKEAKALRCPKCKAQAEIMDLGRIRYLICTDKERCWHREKTK